FALHPLRVESVAWVTERKDVLSGCFGLLALLAYQRYAQQPSLGRYLSVTVAFVLSLLAKPMLVTLPFLLLLLDYWPLQRWRRSRRLASPGQRLLAEKLPLLALSIGCGLITWSSQQASGAVVPLAALPVTSRLANAVVGYAHYLHMTAAPVGLVPLYLI